MDKTTTTPSSQPDAKSADDAGKSGVTQVLPQGAATSPINLDPYRYLDKPTFEQQLRRADTDWKQYTDVKGGSLNSNAGGTDYLNEGNHPLNLKFTDGSVLGRVRNFLGKGVDVGDGVTVQGVGPSGLMPHPGNTPASLGQREPPPPSLGAGVRFQHSFDPPPASPPPSDPVYRQMNPPPANLPIKQTPSQGDQQNNNNTLPENPKTSSQGAPDLDQLHAALVSGKESNISQVSTGIDQSSSVQAMAQSGRDALAQQDTPPMTQSSSGYSQSNG